MRKFKSLRSFIESWRVEKGPDHFDWKCKVLKVSFDKTRIGRWDDFTMAKGPRVNNATKSHRKSSGLSIKYNTTWYV